jgi:hypothetical protein
LESRDQAGHRVIAFRDLRARADTRSSYGRRALIVVRVEVLLDGGDEVGDAVEDAADRFVGELAKPPLELTPWSGAPYRMGVKY